MNSKQASTIVVYNGRQAGIENWGQPNVSMSKLKIDFGIPTANDRTVGVVIFCANVPLTYPIFQGFGRRGFSELQL